MADKPISQLESAVAVSNADLFVVDQSGETKKVTWQLLLAALNAHGGISSIAKTSESGLTDTYTLTYSDGTTMTFNVVNGKGISNVSSYYVSAEHKTYVTISFNDGSASYVFSVRDGEKGDTGATGASSTVFIKYAANYPTSDSDMESAPDAWMGVAVGTVEPAHYTDYAWYNTKGPAGDDGPAGTSPTATVEGGSLAGSSVLFSVTDANGTTTAELRAPADGANIWLSSTAPTEPDPGTPYFLISNLSKGGITASILDWPKNGDMVLYGSMYYLLGRVEGNAVANAKADIIYSHSTGGGGGGTSNYSDLTNKPSINSVTLAGNKTSADLNIKEPFIATYGTTTKAQILAALQANKFVVCKRTDSDNDFYFPLLWASDDGGYYFSAVTYEKVMWVSYENAWDYYEFPRVDLQTTGLPANLGTASRGSATTAARADHVHAMPTAANVGAVAVAQGVAHAGEFVVVGSDGNITTVTMTAWQGGNY